MTTDILIVGAGHNGLVCAFYLASAGLKVKVVERRPVVGGAAVTEEFHPGFRNSVAAYTVSLLNPKVIADMNLSAHGLTVVERRASNRGVLVGGLGEGERPAPEDQIGPLAGPLDRGRDVVGAHRRNGPDQLPGGRVEDLDGAAGLGFAGLPVRGRCCFGRCGGLHWSLLVRCSGIGCAGR